MTPYQIVVEGIFVDVPGTDRTAFGFHTTFYVMANNAPNAVHRVGSMLANRLAVHGVSVIEHGVFGTYCYVRDIWEITSEKFTQNDGKDLGFSFFEIGRLEKIYLALRRTFLRRLKPWLFISLHQTS